MKIDMWFNNEFVPGKYYANTCFFPDGPSEYIYRGNIFDDTGKTIGDYACNDSVEIEKLFITDWKD